MILSTDIGYGHTKYAFNGENEVIIGKFPSAIARIGGGFLNDSIGNSDAVLYNGDYYHTGEKALKETSLIPSRTFDFLLKYSPLLIHSIIEKENIKPDKILTNLSMAEYRENKEQLKKVCSKFIVNDEIYEFDVEVYPQGLGILVNEKDEPKDTIIVDIGFNTIDVLFIEGGEIAPYSSGFTDMGICMLANAVSDNIRKRFSGLYISELESNDILINGYFTFMRKKYDISDFIHSEKVNYTNTVLNHIFTKSEIKNKIRNAGRFIIAGGGAYYLDKEIIEGYEAVIPDRPEYANVLGILKEGKE
jgi:plasmid segregation protein ParM